MNIVPYFSGELYVMNVVPYFKFYWVCIFRRLSCLGLRVLLIG